MRGKRNGNKGDGIWQLYFIRGVAVLAMIIFHFLFILDFLEIKNFSLFAGGWLIFGHIVRILFLGLVGVSLSLSSNESWSKIFRHVLEVGFGALLVSLVTYLFVPESFVKFGILHLITVGILLAGLTRKQTLMNFLVGMIVLIMGFYLPERPPLNYFDLMLGVSPNFIGDLDYFSIFPWLSFIFFGLFLANFFQLKKMKRAAAPNVLVKAVSWLGKQSLWVYLLHIPILFFGIMLIFNKTL